MKNLNLYSKGLRKRLAIRHPNIVSNRLIYIDSDLC